MSVCRCGYSIIATTNRDLNAEIKGGRFLEDLFHRLNVVSLEVPALAQRREISLNWRQKLWNVPQVPRAVGPVSSETTYWVLQAHDWPGNIWELVNVIERILLKIPNGDGEAVNGTDVSDAIGQEANDRGIAGRAMEVMNLPLRNAREEFEKDYLAFHLRRFDGNISRTAEFVGMDRAALHRKPSFGRHPWHWRRTPQRPGGLMKVVICGAGQVGYSIARYLSTEGNDVTVIDQSPELIGRVNETLDVQAIVGHASHPDILESAGVPDADMIIAVTFADEVNMVACQIAHSIFNVPTKIARIRQQSYLEPMWADLFSRDHMPIDVIDFT